MKRNSTSIWAVIFTMVGVFALIASGLLQRAFTAVTIGDEKYNVAQYHIYYYNEYYQYLADHSGEDLTKQGLYSNSRMHRQQSPYGMSWGDYFRKNAESKMEEQYVLCQAAEDAGYALSDSGEEKLEAEKTRMEQLAANSGLKKVKDYLQHVYQPGVTEKMYYTEYEKGLLADEYKQVLVKQQFTPSQDEVEAYAQQKESGDAYTANILLLQMEAPIDRFSQEVGQTQLDNLDKREDNIMAAFEEKGGDEAAFRELAADFSGKSTASDAITAEMSGDASSSESSDAAASTSESADAISTSSGDASGNASYEIHNLRSSNTAYPQEIVSWATSASRVPGDMTTVKSSDGSKVYIAYYVSRGEKESLVNAREALIKQAYSKWLEQQESSITVKEDFLGMRFAR